MFDWLFKKKTKPVRVVHAQIGNIQLVSERGGSIELKPLSAEVRADIEATIRSTPDIPAVDFDKIYEAGLLSASRGHDLHVLAEALRTIDGLTQKRVGAIALLINRRASTLITNKERLDLGIKYANWLCSGAPCGGPKLTAAHQKLDGKRYSIEKGMAIGKRRTWPGMDEGCRCSDTAVI